MNCNELAAFAAWRGCWGSAGGGRAGLGTAGGGEKWGGGEGGWKGRARGTGHVTRGRLEYAHEPESGHGDWVRWRVVGVGGGWRPGTRLWVVPGDLAGRRRGGGIGLARGCLGGGWCEVGWDGWSAPGAGAVASSRKQSELIGRIICQERDNFEKGS